MQHTTFRTKYPPGVFVMFLLQFWTMVGFTMIYALLVLYSTNYLKISDSHSYALSAAYNALAFAIPVLGGFIAEKYLGYRYTCIFSTILAAIGLFILAIPKINSLYLGLAFFDVAIGFLTPCQYVILGRLYKQADARRDSGFTVAYIGMNFGSFIAGFFSGEIISRWGYATAFIIGGLFMVISLVNFAMYYHLFKRREDEEVTHPPEYTAKRRMTGLGITIILIPITLFLIKHATVTNIVLILGTAFCGLLIVYYAFKLTEEKRNKMLAFLILVFVSIAFWSLYQLGPSVLIIFMERNVDRLFNGMTIPASSLSSLNPFFIITVGPLLTILWMKLSQRGIDLSTATKFSSGVILMGLGYLLLVLGIYFHNSLGFVGLIWIVLSYFLQTVGELFVGPIGYSMVGNLVPERLEGLMMGIWQLAAGIAGSISEFLAKLTTTPSPDKSPLQTNGLYSHAFLWFGLITVLVGLITACFIPYLKRISGHNSAKAIPA